jgi:hypothetical protein
MLDVLAMSGYEIINRDNLVPPLEEPVTDV